MEKKVGGDQIDRIIEFAMGRLANWHRPITLKSVGPAFPELFESFESTLAELRRDLRSMLASWYPAGELTANFPESEEFNPLFDVDGRHGSLAKRIARAKANRPQDFVGGWAVKGKEIELAHWRGIPAFNISEATLLSVGRDPRFTDFERLFGTYGRSDEADELLYFLEDRQEQVARAFGLEPDDNRSIVPAAGLLRWILDGSIVVDERFRRMLREQWSQEAQPRFVQSTRVDPADHVPHGTSKKAYARLVTAIAIQRFGLTHEREIGRVALRMRDDTDLAGLGVQAKPIRDLLRIGWGQLPAMDRPK